MNMHMPQSAIAETELRHLAAIPYQLISPAGNSPIIGIFQDSLLGSYRFTRSDIKFTPRDAMNMLMMFNNVDTKKLRENGNKITNFDVLSQILPPLTMVYKTKLFEDNEEYKNSNNVLEIRNGKYVRGQMEKSVLGSSTKGIIHRICNDFNNMASANFIDDLQNIITEYMKSSSFSVGISDLIADKKTAREIVQVITTQKMEVQNIIDKVHLGVFENNTAQSNNVEFEIQVNNTLNKATEQSGKIGRKSLSKDNRFLMIVNSGSKGSLINISQMISCLGQQNVDGKRIPYGFDSRTLPHYSKFDDSPNARGFIENSYISGLTAPELFFHAMGGRIGLIDTAVKTSTTGYIQRRLIKGLEDLKVEYDMTVRNSKGKIVQFAYGDDGFDSTRVENQFIPLVGMSIEDIYMHYDILGVNDRDTELLEIYSKGTITRMKKQRPECRNKCKTYIEKMINAREEIIKNIFKYKDENGIKLPVAFQNIITNIQGQLNLGSNTTVDITPFESFELIEFYFNKVREIYYVPPTELFEIMYYYYLSPKDLLVTKRFHRKALVLLLETIVLKYKQAIVHPGEMVGVIAGQSIGEPTTQLTLNSVIYETEIAVRNSKNEIKKVQIGDFIKEHIKKSKKIEYMEDKDTTYAELDEHTEYYEVPGATEDGQTVWRRIEAVTQHPVINEDGTNTMLKITTKGCREVVATKAKSFLQLVDGKIIGVNGSELKVGDYLPVSRKTLEYTEIFELDLKEILPPTKYIYGTEIEKACNVVDEHHWWSKHANKTFTIPYKRSDTAYSYLKKTCGKNQKIVYEPGFIYTKTNSISNYKIPEKIELDYDFGYLLGAYCAEGCMTKHQMSIANIDNEFYKPILRVCEKFNLTTKIYSNNNKGKEGWRSKDIRIYSTILCNIIDNLCGKLSHNKYVSDKIVFSNKQCICGFLDAYIGGDGTICSNKNRNHINASSTSYKLLLNVQIMMKQLDVTSKIYKCKAPTKDVVFPTYVTKLENIHQGYTLRVANQQCKKLANLLHLTIQYKQDKILLLREKEFKLEYCRSNLVLPNIINGKTIFENRNDMMMDLEFDEIISIEEVANTTDYAYDLTVEDTRNFDCINGLCQKDTFHLSGVASKSNVTRGVPRIEEILRLTKNPKNPSLTVHLKPLDELEQEKAIQYANMMEHTKLVDVVKSIQICFDPQEESTLIEDDKLLMEQYYEFENMVKECNNEDTDDATEIVKSKWIIRMEMDAEILLDKNITMDDIHFAIKNSYYGNDISCVYSDYNSDKLVFRIRMNSNVFKSKKSKGFSEKGLTDPLDQSDDIYLLKNFQDTLLNNIVLRGVNGIENVIPRKLQNMVVKEEGKYVKKDVWILDTTGSNLMDTLAIDFIDNKRTYSNDIKEIFHVLGIEAARQVLYNEFVDVMEFSDVYINYHHLSLLCDRMTCTKNMVPIFRSGILNDDIGPIAKGTFEVHTEVFLNAARHADFDHMRGVSANVMMGQVGYYGTNAFNLVLDMKETEKLTDAQLDITDTNTEIQKMFKISEETSDICSKSNIVIQNNIANIKQGETKICDDDYNMGF
jgi:DNA-directed RNA polymerase beta' subunit